MRMLAYYEEILKEKESPCPGRPQASFLQVIFRIRASPAVYCWTPEMLIHMTRLQFKREYLLLELSLSYQISYFICDNIISTKMFPP
jgi:hypothetical protein